MHWRTNLIALPLMVAAVEAGTLRAPTTEVEAREQGLFYDTRVVVDCRPQEVMDLLTDFEAMPGFISGLDSSRVLARTDSTTRVHQVLTSRLILPWTFRFDLEYRRDGEHRLLFRQVGGNVYDYRGFWEVVPQEEGVEIVCQAQAQHRWRLPRFIMVWILRRQIEGLMPDIAAELERRKGRNGEDVTGEE